MNIKQKRIIAIVCGGFSSEYNVSIKSANGILSWIDRSLFIPYKVIISKDCWNVEVETNVWVPIDKSDFSFNYSGKKVYFDYAYITVHGTPGEDGILQGYFDLLGIQYNTSGVLTESITFNKYFCNRYLSSFGIKTAKSIRLTDKYSYNIDEIISTVNGFPLFVKPNVGGSSFATTKVKDIYMLKSAIDKAFDEAPEVIVEELLIGKEVTCGCIVIQNEIFALPITEVISKNEFFDYDAKYNGAVEEITPARISGKLTEDIQNKTVDICKYLSAKGIIRVDYIIANDGTIQLLEVNTTPGMTPTSFIPQQIVADNKSISRVITAIIMNEKY